MKNPYKAFIPYRMNTALDITRRLLLLTDGISVSPFEERLREQAAPAPAPHQWRAVGLGAVADGMFAVPNAKTITFSVSFGERVLPSKVRDRELTERLAKFTELEGRKPSKKEFAELREDVEHTLLPRAFVKWSSLQATFTDETLFIWTSSHKKADEAASVLVAMIDRELYESIPFAKVTMRGRMAAVLTSIAKGDVLDFEPGRSAVLKGLDEVKRTIRIKDRDILSDEIQSLLKNYEVTTLHIKDSDTCSYVVNENLVFKGLEDEGIADFDKEESHSVCWLATSNAMRHLDAILKQVGEAEITWGENSKASAPAQKPTTPDDDDDEL